MLLNLFAKSNICANLYWLFVFSWVKEKYSGNYFSVTLNFPSIFVENWLSKFSNCILLFHSWGLLLLFFVCLFCFVCFSFNDLLGVNLWKAYAVWELMSLLNIFFFFFYFSCFRSHPDFCIAAVHAWIREYIQTPWANMASPPCWWSCVWIKSFFQVFLSFYFIQVSLWYFLLMCAA